MRVSSTVAAFAAFFLQCSASGQFPWQSPVYNHFFEFPMPIPPVKTPLFTFTSPATGLPIDYYEIEVKPLFRQQYPELPPTRMVGYDGIAPGPTFSVTQGREAVVRHINHGDRQISVHLHGSFSRSPFDGWADDLVLQNQYKDYYYPNRQNARTLWYHDHAADQTAENVYFGQVGFYIMHDAEELASGLPTGQYDIGAVIWSRRYNANGSLWDPEVNNEVVSLYGDVIEVNGQPWPYFAVEPRKYRFRFIGGGISRTFKPYMTNQATGKAVPFTVVGGDAGLATHPVLTNNLTMSIGERWEVVIDFAGMNGQNVTMFNERNVGVDDDFFGTDRIMRFVVGNTVTSTQNNGPVKNPLHAVDFPPNQAITDRHFQFERQNGEWKINGVGWHDIAQRILAQPKRGSIEIWEFQNGGGGWTHPIHVHLVDMQIISRVNGKRGILPYEAVVQKDVVWLDAGETVRVIVRFAPWPGLYMFHCHNLIHEDHEMLAAFNVTQVQGLGLNETNLFIDPTDATYAAKPIPGNDFAARTGDFTPDAIKSKINFFAALDAYADVAVVDAALAKFWAGQPNATVTARGEQMTKRDVMNAAQGWWGKAKRNNEFAQE